jgi:hypothetical protein
MTNVNYRLTGTPMSRSRSSEPDSRHSLIRTKLQEFCTDETLLFLSQAVY